MPASLLRLLVGYTTTCTTLQQPPRTRGGAQRGEHGPIGLICRSRGSCACLLGGAACLTCPLISFLGRRTWACFFSFRGIPRPVLVCGEGDVSSLSFVSFVVVLFWCVSMRRDETRRDETRRPRTEIDGNCLGLWCLACRCGPLFQHISRHTRSRVMRCVACFFSSSVVVLLYHPTGRELQRLG